MSTSRPAHDAELKRVQSSHFFCCRHDNNGHLGCTTHDSSGTNSNLARLQLSRNLWRKLWIRVPLSVLQPYRSKNHPPTHTQRTPLVSQIRWFYGCTGLHVYTRSSVNLTSQSRGQLSSRRTSPRNVYWMPSTWKYRTWDHFQDCSLLSVWRRLLCCCATACCMCHTCALAKPSRRVFFKRAISERHLHVFMAVHVACAAFWVRIVSVGSVSFVGPARCW